MYVCMLRFLDKVKRGIMRLMLRNGRQNLKNALQLRLIISIFLYILDFVAIK